MAEYDERYEAWRAGDGSIHYDKAYADAHNKGIKFGPEGYDVNEVGKVVDKMLAMKESTLIAVCSAFVTGGLIFLGWALFDNYGFKVTLQLWHFLFAIGFGVLLLIINRYVSKTLMIVLSTLPAVLFLLLGAVYMFTGNSEAKKEFKMHRATVNAAELILRVEPSQNAEEVLTLKKDEKLRALGVTKDGWVLIKPDNHFLRRGWAKEEDISVNSGNLKTIQTAQVISNTLKIHKYPRLLSEPVVQTASKGDKIIVTGEERKGWVPVYYISYNDYQQASSVIGYVLASNIFVDDGSGTKAPNGPVAPEGRTGTVKKDAHLKSGQYNSPRFNVKEIKEGETFIILDEANSKGWFRAWYDGIEGWVARRDVKVD